MALAVALGAFGAHGLKSRVGEDLLAIWETATRYHAWHALGLMLMGVMMQVQDASKAPASVYLLLAGILVFSGSLYLLVLTDTRWLGAITPIGGLAFIAGWLLLAIRIIR
jgi:uncharacterized membrane protein YgdD (TMEM256/DUF423 family)